MTAMLRLAAAWATVLIFVLAGSAMLKGLMALAATLVLAVGGVVAVVKSGKPAATPAPQAAAAPQAIADVAVVVEGPLHAQGGQLELAVKLGVARRGCDGLEVLQRRAEPAGDLG